MNDAPIDMIPPEEALGRFDKPDISLLGINHSLEEYHQQRYGFKISGIGFLILPNTLCEVMKNFTVYPIPNTKPWMKGLVNVRGNLIPVYDLSLHLELSSEPMNYESLLIVDRGQDSAGVLIDGLPVPFDTSEWQKLPSAPRLPSGISDCVSETYSVDDVLWLGFDHQTFFRKAMEEVAL